MRHATRLTTLLLLAAASDAALGAQVIIPSPQGGQNFGTSVTRLPNGHFVVTDPGFDQPSGPFNVGAVHHYLPDGSLLATLKGATSSAQVGLSGITILASGDYLVRSPAWNGAGISSAGAVTRVDGETGLNGVVSAANSLVGSSASDLVGQVAPVALPNGAYVVIAPRWDNAGIADAGAVVFGSSAAGVVGPISAANALVGANAQDRIGNGGIVVLANGHWLACTPEYDNGGAIDAGAVSFGSAVSGRSGVVSSSNSLVGASANDQLGLHLPVALPGGNYLVPAPDWDNGALVDVGAVAFGNGTTGLSGTLGPSNALVGSAANDHVGDEVMVLPGGNYLVLSRDWRNGSAAKAGAVTFGNGTSGTLGPVSSSNSLVGSTANDQVGSPQPVILANGNYVVRSMFWDNGAATDAGAVTFGFGNTGRTGVVATSNSLHGTTGGDRVGSEVIALADGGYAVLSPSWNAPGVSGAGAVTTLAGTGGVSGAVASVNSLVGSTTQDFIGSGGGFPLPDGRYVVASPLWDDGPRIDAGAVTLRTSTMLVSGVVGPANSLIGAQTGDEVGSDGVVALPNSAYLVGSSKFSRNSAIRAGALTWAPPVTGRVGVVSEANSLVGSQDLDVVGASLSVTVLANGNAVATSEFWDDGSLNDVGAATFIDQNAGPTGPISALNSLIGTNSGDAVGFGGAVALANGNYLVRAVGWRNGSAANAGAVTLGSGTLGTHGPVGPANSIVGSTGGDQVGEVTAAGNGNFIVRSRFWDNGGVIDAGAFTLGLASGGVNGAIDATHSVVGPVRSDGVDVAAYDELRNQLIVGQPRANRVVLHRTGTATTSNLLAPTENPSEQGAAVPLQVIVSAAQGDLDGLVTIRASNGQQCTDTTGQFVSAGAELFSCNIVFGQTGQFQIFAEFLGSTQFAYSRSNTRAHQVIDTVFRNGFE